MIENKESINRIQFFSYLALSGVILLSFLISEPVFAKTVRYVSDELKIPLRSGASNKHRIIKFLRSGTALTVLSNEDKFTEVEMRDGKSGWVLTTT